MPSDPIFKKAIQKRDEATLEMRRWDEWIKTYVELTDSIRDESLDIPMPKKTSAVHSEMATSSEPGSGQTLWPREAS